MAKKKESLMAQQCPLLFRQVDATVTRINTLFIISGVCFYLITREPMILIALIGDFMLRLYGLKSYSPVQNASLWIKRRLSLSPKMEDAGAKRLASFFGMGFATAMVTAHLIGAEWAIYTIASIYISCAALELLFGYCIACKLYHWIQKIYPKGIA